MKKPPKQFAIDAGELVYAFFSSAGKGLAQRKSFGDVEKYCMFLGYPRSGHSLIGALLDAHPNMVIANELDAFRYVYARFTRTQIYSLILDHSHKFAQSGWRKRRYKYKIPGQAQGTYRALRVIGDKHGESSTLRLHQCPGLWDRLQKVVCCPIHIVHVVRNPFDNISSIAKLKGWNLEESITYYFSLCNTVQSIQQRVDGLRLFEFRHEEFVADPGDHLRRLCEFLGEGVTDSYIRACKNFVRPNPNRTRHSVHWREDLLELVQTRSVQYTFLNGYKFDD